MTDTRIHYKYDALSTKRACGYNGDGSQTDKLDDVTCGRCKAGILYTSAVAARGTGAAEMVNYLTWRTQAMHDTLSSLSGELDRLAYATASGEGLIYSTPQYRAELHDRISQARDQALAALAADSRAVHDRMHADA